MSKTCSKETMLFSMKREKYSESFVLHLSFCWNNNMSPCVLQKWSINNIERKLRDENSSQNSGGNCVVLRYLLETLTFACLIYMH